MNLAYKVLQSRLKRDLPGITSAIRLLTTTLAVVLIGVSTASAQYAGGFAWADQLSADEYSPSSGYSYNSTTDQDDSGVTITRTGTGVYNVEFAGLETIGANGGHVQVSGYLNDASYCNVGGWSSNAASVYCFDTAGNAADAYFTIAFLKPEAATPGLAYAWGDEPTLDSYTPSPFYSYNSAGGDITINRSGVGSYSVEFLGYDAVGTNGGDVQVSSYGGTNISCKVTGWGTNTVYVACYDVGGDPVDSYFTVLYAKPEAATGNLAYAWADQPSADAYAPSIGYSYNASGSDVGITRSSVGTYNVSFTDYGAIGFNGGHVQVTAYNGTSERCKVSGWGSASVNVVCYDIAGNPVDSYFTALYWKPEAPNAGEELNGVSFAWANDPTADSYLPNISYLINESGLNATITRGSTGSYNVLFDGLAEGPLNSGTVQLSAYSGAANDCEISSWGSSELNVLCFDQTGAAADAYYSVLFLSPTEETTGLAYAWAHDASADSYTPAESYSYNSAGGDITITRSAVGTYVVSFADYGAVGANGGHVQVSSYGNAGERCHTTGWGGSSVGVTCSDAAGDPVDSRFTILFLKPEMNTPGMAYAWANDAASDSYTPDPFYSFNAGGGDIVATRSGVGQYNMSFGDYGDVGANGGNVQVSAYGSTNARCWVASWAADNVNVTCVDGAGAPVDVLYDVLYLKPTENTGTAIGDESVLTADADVITNYPNPFRGSTTITYSLESATPVVLSVYDITGRLVNKLVDGVQAGGTYAVPFDATGLSSGVYLYSLKTADNVRVGKMIVGR